MKKTRKGFTLVELLVVIAILAILATVSIIGYTSFIRRAEISNATTFAAQLNSILEASKHTEDISDINKVMKLLKENGIEEKDLTSAPKGLYYAWDSYIKRFLVVEWDGNVDNKYKTHSAYTNSEDQTNWYIFASDADAIAYFSGKGMQTIVFVSDPAAVKALLASGGEHNVYITEDMLITKETAININKSDANITLNLGDATFGSNTSVGASAIYMTEGSLVVNGGTISAYTGFGGTGGLTLVGGVETRKNSSVEFNNTTFDYTGKSGVIMSTSDAKFQDINVISAGVYAQVTAGKKVIFNNANIDSGKSFCLWLVDYQSDSSTHTTFEINGGTYNFRGFDKKYSTGWDTIKIAGGKLVITDGTFINEFEKYIFHLSNQGNNAEQLGATTIIEIRGGTFIVKMDDGTMKEYQFEDLTTDIIEKMCRIGKCNDSAYNYSVTYEQVTDETGTYFVLTHKLVKI